MSSSLMSPLPQIKPIGGTGDGAGVSSGIDGGPTDSLATIGVALSGQQNMGVGVRSLSLTVSLSQSGSLTYGSFGP